MPFYDLLLIPIAQAVITRTADITMLKRTGIFLSVISMVLAALVEMKRLQVVEEYGLFDNPNVIIPMSVWWLIQQYVMFGVANAFIIVGLQEFFYDQVPTKLRSVSFTLYLSIFGVGNFLSSILISVINKITSGNDHNSWVGGNLNQTDLDYFYWLLAGLNVIGLIAHMHCSK